MASIDDTAWQYRAASRALQSQHASGKDQNQGDRRCGLVRAYPWPHHMRWHADGYDSQDSEAYIPLVRSTLQSTATDSSAKALQSGGAPQRRLDCATDFADGLGEAAGDSNTRLGSPATESMAAAAVQADASAGSSKAGTSMIADRPEKLLSTQGIQEDSTHGIHRSDDKKRQRKAQRKGKTDKQKRNKGHDGTDLGIESQTKAQEAGGCTSSDQRLEQLRKAALEWANKVETS